MSKDDIVIDDYLIKVSKWQHFKLWLRYRRDYERITVWTRKGAKNEKRS